MGRGGPEPEMGQLRAACELQHLALSMDSSEWLVGGRHGFLVFRHTRTGKLQRAPARVLGRSELTRAERNAACAQAINAYFNAGGLDVSAAALPT